MKSVQKISALAIFVMLVSISVISATAAQFTPGNIYIAGSRNAEIFEFDPSLNLVSQWTHPSFGTILPPPGQSHLLGPAGMAFDADGNLVVAACDQFCVFSAPNVLVGCHPKIKSQPTENIIFDTDGNLYTTTSTSGTNEIHKYDANFNFITTFSMPTGELTGITCDPDGNLYIASQKCNCIYKVNKTSFAVLDTISDIGSGLEGLQFTYDGDILVARSFTNADILRIKASSPLVVLDVISDPGLLLPVPLTIDNAGNIYTADYEDGSGSLLGDIFIFDPNGNLIAAKRPSIVYGPFGMVVAGTRLPCGDLCGDLDGNGIVNILDTRLLMNNVSQVGYPVNPWAGDVDGSDSIDMADMQLLLNHVFNPTRYPLTCRRG
jgi:DNA-binding beta-propeller fold protein YncE